MTVTPCLEQINRQLTAINHKNMHELASLRFLKLNLECQNIKMGRRTNKRQFFSFMRLCLSCNRIPIVVATAPIFFKKAAVIIAIHGQKTLHNS